MSDSFKQIVGNLKKLIPLLKDNNIEKVEKVLNYCKSNVLLMQKAIKKTNSCGEKRNLETCLGHMKKFIVDLTQLIHVGAGVNNDEKESIIWRDISSAFKSRIRTGVFINKKYKDPQLFLQDAGKKLKVLIKKILKKFNTIKFNLSFCCEFQKFNSDGTKVSEYKYLTTANKTIDIGSDLENIINNVKNELLTSLEEFQERDSGWALSEIINLAVNINKYVALSGSSYIDLPTQIKKKKACVNVKNLDNACFAWSIVSALHPVSKNADRPNSYPYYGDVLNLDNITFPIQIKDISKFENNNNLSINIYTLNKNKNNSYTVEPIRLSNKKLCQHINLLMFQDSYKNNYNDNENGNNNDNGDDNNDDDDDDVEINYHFCWIKDLSRLVSSQLTRHGHKVWICERCLHYFHTEAKLIEHAVDCNDINTCKIILPEESEKWLNFHNYKYKERCPYIIYADTESILRQVDIPVSDYTNRYQKHEMHSIAYYFVCSYDSKLNFYRSFRGPNCGKWFADELKSIAEDVETTYLCEVPMEEINEKLSFKLRNQETCHICERYFIPNDVRVIDHCHFTGKIRGMAHQSCNLNYQDNRIIPVVFHNLSGYDAHFIIKDVALTFDGKVNLLPLNKEKYIAFTKTVSGYQTTFKFIDSFRFLPSSLEKLASYCDEFKLIQEEFPNNYHLLCRKGVFPYDYIDNWGKLNEQQLPSQEKFYNRLNDSSITNEEYSHAKKVWNAFNINTLGEYSDLYLKSDVFLLAEIFENFRNSCLTNYRLDPAHYYTTPGLSWDAMLLYTKVKLELVTDIDMLLFIERGIRGGVTQCSGRYSKANNKYMTDYNTQDLIKFIMYFDVNNLYGWAMSQNLPQGNFKWVEDIDIENIPDDSKIGYLLEVDLGYP